MTMPYKHHALDDIRKELSGINLLRKKILHILATPMTSMTIIALINDAEQAYNQIQTDVDKIHYTLINMQHDSEIVYDKTTKRYSAIKPDRTLRELIYNALVDNPASGAAICRIVRHEGNLLHSPAMEKSINDTILLMEDEGILRYSFTWRKYTINEKEHYDND